MGQAAIGHGSLVYGLCTLGVANSAVDPRRLWV
jgi:hypothetical protein